MEFELELKNTEKAIEALRKAVDQANADFSKTKDDLVRLGDEHQRLIGQTQEAVSSGNEDRRLEIAEQIKANRSDYEAAKDVLASEQKAATETLQEAARLSQKICGIDKAAESEIDRLRETQATLSCRLSEVTFQRRQLNEIADYRAGVSHKRPAGTLG